jgi:hypothetical protein
MFGVSHKARTNEELDKRIDFMLQCCVKFNFKSVMYLLDGPGATQLVLNSFLAELKVKA